MNQPVHFRKKLIATAVGLALSGGMSGTVLAESPSNEELWQKIQEQQRMIEQQQKLIDQLSTQLGETQQTTNKYQQQIDEAARSVKAVEAKAAEAKKEDAEGWFGPVSVTSSSGYRDKISFTTAYTYWIPDDSARRYGASCLGDETACSSTTNVFNAPGGTEEFFSDTSNFSGGIKWTREFDTHDFAFGFDFAKFASDQYKFSNSDDGEFQVPYGNLDSSSAGANGTLKDNAWYVKGDFEYGWRKGGPNNIRLMAGLRGEFLDWSRTGQMSMSSSQDYQGDENSTFYGLGPKIGASFERPISSSRRLSIFGGISGGVMLGYLDHSWDLDNATTDRNLYKGDSGFSAAPFGQGEVGFGFVVTPDVQLQLGFQGGYEGNVLHTAQVCKDASDDDIRPNITSCANNDTDAGVLFYAPFLRFNAYF